MTKKRRVRVFFDENIPRPFGKMHDEHEVADVERMGWKGKKNGELLSLVEAEFYVMLTSDRALLFQHNLTNRKLSLVVLPTQNLTLSRANAIAVRVTLDELEALDHRAIAAVDWRGRRKMRRLDQAGALEVELTQVTGFSPG